MKQELLNINSNYMVSQNETCDKVINFCETNIYKQYNIHMKIIL